MISHFFSRSIMNLQRFRGGLVFKAHGPLYHSTVGLRIIIKKKKKTWTCAKLTDFQS